MSICLWVSDTLTDKIVGYHASVLISLAYMLWGNVQVTLIRYLIPYHGHGHGLTDTLPNLVILCLCACAPVLGLGMGGMRQTRQPCAHRLDLITLWRESPFPTPPKENTPFV